MTDPPQEPPEHLTRAAQLRAQAWSYKDIAAELGCESPAAARRCAVAGFSLVPGQDLSMFRRRAAAELDPIRQQLRKIIPEGGTP